MKNALIIAAAAAAASYFAADIDKQVAKVYAGGGKFRGPALVGATTALAYWAIHKAT